MERSGEEVSESELSEWLRQSGQRMRRDFEAIRNSLNSDFPPSWETKFRTNGRSTGVISITKEVSKGIEEGTVFSMRMVQVGETRFIVGEEKKDE